MSAISNAMGMSKAGVLHYFSHKKDILHSLLDPLFEKVEKLVDGEPEPLEILERYLDLMLEERELIALLGQDLSILAQPEIGGRVYELNNRLLELASGSGADFTRRVQAEHALGGMRSVVVRFGGEDDETLRAESLKAAAAALNIGQ